MTELSAIPVRLGQPSPVLRSETTAILKELGYSDSEITGLESAGVVNQVDS